MAIATLGATAAGALRNRLSDLRAAESVTDVLAGRPRNLSVNGLDCFQFDLADQFVLTITSNHAPARLDARGHTDWLRVRRVKVVSVEQ